MGTGDRRVFVYRVRGLGGTAVGEEPLVSGGRGSCARLLYRGSALSATSGSRAAKCHGERLGARPRAHGCRSDAATDSLGGRDNSGESAFSEHAYGVAVHDLGFNTGIHPAIVLLYAI